MKVIYHLGYPRTGTTYLQKNLFPLHREINYAGPKDYIQSHQTALTLQKLDLLGNIYTSKEIEDDKYDLNELKKIIDIEKFSKDKVNIVSSERYTMFTNINEFNDIKLLNKFLKSFYPNLEVEFLIVLRNQYDLIKSLYFHKYRWISKILNIKNFNEFVKFLRKDLPFNTDNYLFLNFDVIALAFVISYRAIIFFSLYIFFLWLYSHKLKRILFIGNLLNINIECNALSRPLK